MNTYKPELVDVTFIGKVWREEGREDEREEGRDSRHMHNFIHILMVWLIRNINGLRNISKVAP